jgi:hypothetical protein
MDPLINEINQLVYRIQTLSEELEVADEIIDSLCEDSDLSEDLVEAVLSEEEKKKKKWIQKAIEKEGSLRKSLKTKEGKNIPVSKLKSAAKKGGKMGKRARLALTLRKLNEAAYNIPAKAEEMGKDPSSIGVLEMEGILSRGGSPAMAGGQTKIPDNIRQEALAHLKVIKGHPKGKVEGYGPGHQIHKEASAAHEFFKKHFPEFGVEDQIAFDYGLGQPA